MPILGKSVTADRRTEQRRLGQNRTGERRDLTAIERLKESTARLENIRALREDNDRLRASNVALVAALKGTVYLFEARAVSKTDLEQIAFARAALKAAE